MREQGFFATEDAIQEQATSVLADFYALYEMEQYSIFDDPRDTFFYVQGLIADRLERAILTLASLARANDDGGEGFRLHSEKRPEGVGTLIEGETESVLTAREACNKIIHAKTAKFEFDEENGHPIYQHLLVRDFGEFDRAFKRPKIHVTGERHGGKEWAAIIDVVLWIHAVMHYSTEPPRILRRLQPLRKWSHEEISEVLPRSPRARSAPGHRVPQGSSIAVGCH